jgi:predicted ATP-dependent Lon-type protease
MKWMRKELLSEIDAGYVTQFEYDNVVKFFGRFLLQAKFLLYLDIAGYFRITRMFNLLVKLAFRKKAYKREQKKSQLQEIVNLRKRVSDLRLKFAK